MSPVAPSGGHASRALVVATVSVILLMGGLFLASLALSNRKSSDLRLGPATFQGGSSRRLAGEIAERGPILYADVSGQNDRDIYLQHLGSNTDKGWYAFVAAPADKPRSCTWQWQKGTQTFRAKCDHRLTAPADGTGLTRFPVVVRDGKLDVDLNADARTSTGKTSTTRRSTSTTSPR